MVWTQRLRDSARRGHTVLAEEAGGLIAFAHTVFEDDPAWGALLDNLHVSYGHKRRVIGSQLLALTARAVVERGTVLFLWVLEQNRDAQVFYEARGGRHVDRAPAWPPGGLADRLNGSPVKLRYAWADPAVLLASLEQSPRARGALPAFFWRAHPKRHHQLPALRGNRQGRFDRARAVAAALAFRGAASAGVTRFTTECRFGVTPPSSALRSESRMDAEGVGLLFGCGMAITMTAALLLKAHEDQRALAWGITFGALAVIQIGRLINISASGRDSAATLPR